MGFQSYSSLGPSARLDGQQPATRRHRVSDSVLTMQRCASPMEPPTSARFSAVACLPACRTTCSMAEIHAPHRLSKPGCGTSLVLTKGPDEGSYMISRNQNLELLVIGLLQASPEVIPQSWACLLAAKRARESVVLRLELSLSEVCKTWYVYFPVSELTINSNIYTSDSHVCMKCETCTVASLTLTEPFPSCRMEASAPPSALFRLPPCFGFYDKKGREEILEGHCSVA